MAAVAGEFVDERIDPGVLPDEGVVQRLAGALVPDQRRLALVGDADGGEVAGAKPFLCERLADHRLACCARSPAGRARHSPACG